MPRFLDPQPLGHEHRINSFKHGVGSLNVWLVKHARAFGVGSVRTYVVIDTDHDRVVGYHASRLPQSSMTRPLKEPEGERHATRSRPSCSHAWQSTGRFRSADSAPSSCGMRWRGPSVAEQAAIRMLLVHANNDDARRFYEHFGFEPSPTDPMNLQLIIKDIRASLDSA